MNYKINITGNPDDGLKMALYNVNYNRTENPITPEKLNDSVNLLNNFVETGLKQLDNITTGWLAGAASLALIDSNGLYRQFKKEDGVNCECMKDYIVSIGLNYQNANKAKNCFYIYQLLVANKHKTPTHRTQIEAMFGLKRSEILNVWKKATWNGRVPTETIVRAVRNKIQKNDNKPTNEFQRIPSKAAKELSVYAEALLQHLSNELSVLKSEKHKSAGVLEECIKCSTQIIRLVNTSRRVIDSKNDGDTHDTDIPKGIREYIHVTDKPKSVVVKFGNKEQ